MRPTASPWRDLLVPATALATGIVDGKLVVPASIKGTFVIDVGATKSSPVAPLDVDQVQISEDVRGALFRLICRTCTPRARLS